MPMINTVLSNKHNSVCAFCRYWYDPANSYIKPQKFGTNKWSYEKNARCKCLKYGIGKPAYLHCSSYECKVPVK